MPAPRPTKAQRREQAIAEAARLRAEQKQREKRRRLIAIVSIIAAVVVLAAIVMFILQDANKSAMEKVEVKPANTTETGAMLMGKDLVAGGELTPDVPTLKVFTDPICPWCGEFEKTNGEDIASMVEAGKINLEIHMVSILDQGSTTNYSTRATDAVAVVANEEPDKVYQFIQAIYANQPAEGGPGLSDDELASLAQGVGVSAATTEKFAGDTYNEWVAAATQEAASFAKLYPTVLPKGLSTPFVLINDIPLDSSAYYWLTPGQIEQAVTDYDNGELKYQWTGLPSDLPDGTWTPSPSPSATNG